MKRLFVTTAVIMVMAAWTGCKKEAKTAAPNTPPQTEQANNGEEQVKAAYSKFIEAQRKCDRQALQGLITPRTWTAMTKTKTKNGDMVDLLCKKAQKGNVVFEGVKIEGERASLSVKIGDQPANEVRMALIEGKWMLGEPGKPAEAAQGKAQPEPTKANKARETKKAEQTKKPEQAGEKAVEKKDEAQAPTKTGANPGQAKAIDPSKAKVQIKAVPMSKKINPAQLRPNPGKVHRFKVTNVHLSPGKLTPGQGAAKPKAVPTKPKK